MKPKKTKQIRVVIAKAGQRAVEAMIDNNLRGIQAAIGGGYIENVSLPSEFGEIHGYADEDGISKGLPFNRVVPTYGGPQPILGDLVFLGMKGCEEASLDNNQVSMLVEFFNRQITFGG